MRFTDEALVAAVELSDRYLTDRVLPDKAIDLIDQAGGAPAAARRRPSRSTRRRWRRSSAASSADENGRRRRALRGGARSRGPRSQRCRTTLAEATRPPRQRAPRGHRRGRSPRWSRGPPASRSAQLTEEERDRLRELEERAARARHRPGRRGRPRSPRPCAAAAPGLGDPNRPVGIVPVPRADGRRQDRAGAGAGRRPVRRRGPGDPLRHERVRRAAHRDPARRRPSRIRRLRRGRAAHRARAAQPVLDRAVRRDREGAPRRVQPAAAGARRRTPDRRPGPHGRLPQHRRDHDEQPRLRTYPGARPPQRGLRGAEGGR